ncbi:LOW QUALITY PROTEIN: hypothetical protein Ahia01_000729200, partial [Argonauta hians]
CVAHVCGVHMWYMCVCVVWCVCVCDVCACKKSCISMFLNVLKCLSLAGRGHLVQLLCPCVRVCVHVYVHVCVFRVSRCVCVYVCVRGCVSPSTMSNRKRVTEHKRDKDITGDKGSR